jgi:amidase
VAEPPGGKIDPIIANTVRGAADVLARAGYDVVEATPPRYAEAQDVWGRFLFTDFAVALAQMMALMGKDGVSFLEESLRIIPPYSDAASLSQLLIKRDGIAREWSLFMEEHPLVLTPTWTQLPFEHGADAKGAEGAAFTFEMMRPVTHANLLGLPSACVPAGRDAKTNLPIGVLVNGRRLREDLCLEAAEAIEAKLGLPTPIEPE